MLFDLGTVTLFKLQRSIKGISTSRGSQREIVFVNSELGYQGSRK